MVIRILFFCSFLISILLSSCFCKEDMWGDELIMILPINTTPPESTFSIGDTLWIKANITKNVEVLNSQNTVFADSFEFFTDIGVSEISSENQEYDINIDVISEIGTLTKRDLPTAVLYNVEYLELETEYQLLAGIVFNDPGTYFFRFSILADKFEYVDHPLLYKCKQERRSTVTTYFSNLATNFSDYENIFLNSPVENIESTYPYELYGQLGSHTFIVSD